MKNISIYFLLLTVVTLNVSCEQNEIMPSYQKKGTATQTVAAITVSNNKPAPSETITVTLSFVNTSEDPIKEVQLRAKIGTNDFALVQTFDETSAEKNAQIEHQVQYQVPASSGAVVLEMRISSQKEYPQLKQTSITVQ